MNAEHKQRRAIMNWEKIKKQLKEGAALSMEKIEEYTKIGKLKIDELAAKRKIDRNLIDIGGRVVDLVADGKGKEVDADLVVKKAIGTVKSLRQEIAAIDEKIKAIRAEAAAKAHKKSEEEDDELTGI
jgi:hypothetical protein